MFEYKLTFLEFGCSNSTYYNCSWLRNDYLVSFYSDYTDNIFQMLICCSWHLNHGHIYVPVVAKMQIFNEFMVTRLPILWTYIHTFGSSCD